MLGDIPVGISGNEGKITAFALDADIPTLLRKGAGETLGGQLGFSRDALELGKQGAAIPPPREQDWPLFPWCDRFRRGRIDESARSCGFGLIFRMGLILHKSPNLPHGGLREPYTEDGSYQSDPPRTFSARKAVTLGDSMDSCLSDPRKIAM